jgi:hypothetical protein
LKAITVKPIWAWAIIYAGKNIENRSRRTHIRGPVAIHASKNMSRSEYEKAKELFPRRCRNKLPAYEDLPRGVIIGIAEIIDCVTESKSEWFIGDDRYGYGYVLKNQRPVKLIPCSGAQNFWNLPPEIDRKIKRAI